MPEGSVRKRLKSAGVTPRRSRGQNFLTDDAIARRIVEFALVSLDVPVLEIGPGLGILTQHLAPRVKQFVAIELEVELAKDLAKRFPQAQIIQSDIRDIRLDELLPEGGKFVVVGNIPYSISTDIVFWFLRERLRIRHASFLFQREFAERLGAAPGGRDYSSLTVQRELYATSELGDIVPGDVFHPAAAVQSRLIRLTPRENPLVSEELASRLESVVRSAFGKRRKTILNALAGSSEFPDKVRLRTLLQELGIDEKRRPETVSVQEFLALAQKR